MLLPKSAARKLPLRYKNFPQMVAPIINKDGREIGCQVTALSADMTKKLAVEKPKRTYGKLKASGGYVELGAADPDGPLLMAEGIETALSGAQLADRSAIAVGGVGFMKSVEPPPCSEIIILVDNDPDGKKRAAEAAERLTARGIEVRMAVAPEGDWNDILVHAMKGDLPELKRAILSAPPFTLTDADAIDRRLDELAQLATLDYELARKQAAKDLGLRGKVLDQAVQERREDSKLEPFMADVEPWPEPVDGEELLSGIRDVLTRHLVLPKAAPITMALWVIHAHAHELASHSPNLSLTSPTMQCGKTQTLWVLSYLVPKHARCSLSGNHQVAAYAASR